MYAGLYGIIVVVARLHNERRGAAGLVNIPFGTYIHHEAAVSGQHGAAADDVAAGVIGDVRFHAIAIVGLVIGHGSGEGDDEPAILIELAFLVGKLVAAGIVGIAGVDLAESFAVVGIVEKREPVLGAVDGVLHFGAGHRLAEEVTGVDGGLRGIAFEDARLGGHDTDFVLGLLVLFHVEATLHIRFRGRMNQDGVSSQRGRGGEREFVVQRAVGAGSESFPVDRLLFGVLNLHGERFRGGDIVPANIAKTHNSSEMHRVAGAVDRPVGIDVAIPVAAEFRAVVQGADSAIGVLPGDDAQVRRRGAGRFDLGDTVAIGLERALAFIAHQRVDLRAAHRFAGTAVGHEGHHAAVAGLSGEN